MAQSPDPNKEHLSKIIADKCDRRLKAQQEKRKSIFFGLGMIGTVGWMIAVPTVIGVMLGRFLDRLYKNGVSWTLTLIFAGLCVGCFIAWQWMNKEGKS
ncbi:MAG: AtpZ/AtpI family protein [Desulfosarcina sp.]|nr:AtpZ/AtpI family protein [Desulfosarcina sp.]MBC2742234.1 AtpZ/AtpI family protein [Desulfosarcina sp.]MBC2765146.1 ATPase F0F1 [Desulfosarcina sp.]